MNFLLRNTFIIAGLWMLIGCSNPVSADKVSQRLHEFLKQKNYFKLNALLQKSEASLESDQLLYYQAHIAKAFGKSKRSNTHIERLIEKYQDKLNDTLMSELLDIQGTNYVYSYQYKQASKAFAVLLKNYAHLLTHEERSDYSNSMNLFEALADVPPQIMHSHETEEIPSYRNKINHIMTPVSSHGLSSEFVFDTGANFSTISLSQAKNMNFDIIESAIEVGSSTHLKVQSKLAVADSLYLGNLLFENVIFLVLPDEQLNFPAIDYRIHGIIGFPVIHQLKEIHIHKNGNMTIPKNPGEKIERNMFLNDLNPIVQVKSEKDTLLFTFDTGAKSSELSYKYYKEHKQEVEQRGIKQTQKRGGAGGTTEVEEYALANFPIQIGSKETVLPQIPVSLEEYDFNKDFDGNLGQDVFTQFHTLILNFEYMYMLLK